MLSITSICILISFITTSGAKITDKSKYIANDDRAVTIKESTNSWVGPQVPMVLDKNLIWTGGDENFTEFHHVTEYDLRAFSKSGDKCKKFGGSIYCFSPTEVSYWFPVSKVPKDPRGPLVSHAFKDYPLSLNWESLLELVDPRPPSGLTIRERTTYQPKRDIEWYKAVYWRKAGKLNITTEGETQATETTFYFPLSLESSRADGIYQPRN